MHVCIDFACGFRATKDFDPFSFLDDIRNDTPEDEQVTRCTFTD
jgi:hypothetical protein